MAFETSEPPFLRHINGLRNGINRNGINRGGFNVGGKKGFLHDIERRVDKLSTTQLVLLAAGGVLVVDHLIAPKGMSFVSKAWEKVSPGGAHKALPPPPPPPVPVIPPPIAAKGMYAGANRQAGWNRGMSPYGGWAVANPMEQYAHAAMRQNWGERDWYDWEE
jgi:hypothetical protein